MKGFTLIEIFIIIVIILFISTLFFSIGLNFYKGQQFQTNTQQILQTLRKAQLKAMAGEAGLNFGVHFDNNNKKYTLFWGDPYGDPSRDVQYDEIFYFPQIITVGGLSEIVFLKLGGGPNPSTGGDIIISSNGQTKTININEAGRINLEL